MFDYFLLCYLTIFSSRRWFCSRCGGTPVIRIRILRQYFAQFTVFTFHSLHSSIPYLSVQALKFFHISSYNLPTGTLYSVLNLSFCTSCVKLASIISEREGSRAKSEPVPLTNGSGSRRPKNMRILRIRIPNTARRTSERELKTQIFELQWNRDQNKVSIQGRRNTS